MVSFENLVFDPTFYAFGTVIVCFLTATVVIAIMKLRGSKSIEVRKLVMGTVLFALGAIVTTVGVVLLSFLSRSGEIDPFLYLQSEFLDIYFGFGLILSGIQFTVYAGGSKLASTFRALTWLTFAASSTISAAFLLNRATYAVSFSGSTMHVAQQLVFWLPVFLTSCIGLVVLPVLALRAGDSGLRSHASLFAVSILLVLVGCLKESNLIPSSGDPLRDLLVSFVPFTTGSVILLLAASRLPSSYARKLGV